LYKPGNCHAPNNEVGLLAFQLVEGWLETDLQFLQPLQADGIKIITSIDRQVLGIWLFADRPGPAKRRSDVAGDEKQNPAWVKIRASSISFLLTGSMRAWINH